MKKIFKRLVAVVLAVVMTLGAAPLAGFVGIELSSLSVLFSTKAVASNEYTKGYYTYTVDDNGNATITDVDTSISGIVTIPSTFGSHPVTSIGSFAFDYCYNITMITIPDGVTSIDDSAFSGCTGLASITIPDSVTSIGSGAFDSFYFSNLITYYTGTPEEWSQISIGSNNGYLTWNLIFESNSAEPYYGSGTCGENLTWKLHSYGEFEISGTGTMTNYNLDTPWFSIRSKIEYVTIAEGVTSIGDYAFEGCTKLTSITIPDSVTDIGNCSFKDCTALPIILIPDNVTRIGYYAFENCTDFVNMYIPASVTKIENYAFNGCTNLTNVYYYGDIASWCGIIFGNSYSNPMYYADSLYINDTLVSGELVIPSDVARIGNYAFYNCADFTSVTISASIIRIGNSAFYNCNNLTSTYYQDTKEEWDKITIGSNNSNLTKNIIFESNSKRPYYSGTCGENLIWKLYNDGELVISGSGAMEDYASSSLVPWYSKRSFIKSVTLPSGITSIGDCAFEDCTNLSSITIPDGVITIGKSSFEKCTSISEIKIPDNTTSIEYRAFYGCTSLKNVIVSDSVTVIHDNAFYDCTALESITIGKSVTSICYNTFFNCTEIKDVYYNGTEKNWNAIIFDDGNESLKNSTVHFGDTLVEPEPHEHSYTSKITTPATHLTTGIKTYICECGDSYTEVIEKNATHTYKTVVTAPTCIEKGYTTYMCECGDFYIDSYTDKIGHSYASEITTPATHLTTGIMTYTCECGDTYSEIIEKKKTHTFDSVVTEPTCTKNGYTTYFCACGEYYTETISSTGHKSSEWQTIIEPSVAFEGKKVQICTVCGITLKEETIEKIIPPEPIADSSVIKTPSITTINYGDTIILNIEKSKVPEGGSILWIIDNGNFEYDHDGECCEITPKKSGDTTFKVIVYDKHGIAISYDEQTMTSKAGFFDKVIAFFKKLFGATKVIPQEFKGII